MSRSSSGRPSSSPRPPTPYGVLQPVRAPSVPSVPSARSAGPSAPVPDAAPAAGECLVCFVLRRVEAAGCDNTLRWARVFRDGSAPGDLGLEKRLAAAGGYCDCEILLNAFVPAAAVDDEEEWPEELPACAGVRAGSAVPCRHWVSANRWRS